MRRPRLLDLFCGAGGAAMGYHRAGFDVVGVDIDKQPRYPFECHQADALTFSLDGFDAIHASPMWLGFTWQAFKTEAGVGDDTVTPIYDRLRASGKPWVCESGSFGPLPSTALFCGPAFGLKVIRHMRFASSELLLTPGCVHRIGGCADGEYAALRGVYNKDRDPARRSKTDRPAYQAAAGIPWIKGRAADLAVPPAYTGRRTGAVHGVCRRLGRAREDDAFLRGTHASRALTG